MAFRVIHRRSFSLAHRVLIRPDASQLLLLAAPSIVRRSFSTRCNDDSFAKDTLFPAPTDDNIEQYGMPLLARAAYHARMGRTLAYDMYIPSSSIKSNGAAYNREGKKIVYSYHEVLTTSTHLHKFFAKQKKENLGSPTDMPQRIAFLCHPGPHYIATQFAAWSSGSIAVPLCISHRSSELAYVLRDCDPAFVIDGTSSLSEGRELRSAARDAGLMDRYWCLDDMMADFTPSESLEKAREEGDKAGGSHEYALGSNGNIPSGDHPALIIYTSGTTGNPKGVVHTHKNIYYQITDLVTSWGWSKNDSILHFLPLHHVHGGTCPLFVCIHHWIAILSLIFFSSYLFLQK